MGVPIGDIDLSVKALKYAIEQARQAKPILYVHPYSYHLAKRIAFEAFGEKWEEALTICRFDASEREHAFEVELSVFSRGA